MFPFDDVIMNLWDIPYRDCCVIFQYAGGRRYVERLHATVEVTGGKLWRYMGTSNWLASLSPRKWKYVIKSYVPSTLKYRAICWCLLENPKHENSTMCHKKSIIRWNSLWPSDAIWWQGSRSTLIQVMTCCLTAPSHYLNQCWFINTKVQWCLSEDNFAWDVTATSH